MTSKKILNGFVNFSYVDHSQEIDHAVSSSDAIKAMKLYACEKEPSGSVNRSFK